MALWDEGNIIYVCHKPLIYYWCDGGVVFFFFLRNDGGVVLITRLDSNIWRIARNFLKKRKEKEKNSTKSLYKRKKKKKNTTTKSFRLVIYYYICFGIIFCRVVYMTMTKMPNEIEIRSIQVLSLSSKDNQEIQTHLNLSNWKPPTFQRFTSTWVPISQNFL